jgi:hypothetical protein
MFGSLLLFKLFALQQQMLAMMRKKGTVIPFCGNASWCNLCG